MSFVDTKTALTNAVKESKLRLDYLRKSLKRNVEERARIENDIQQTRIELKVFDSALKEGKVW